MEELIQIIKQSFETTTIREAKKVKDFDCHEIAYKILSSLEEVLGKTKPEQEKKIYTYWTSQTPMTNIACMIGRLVLVGKEDPEASVKDRNVRRFRVGYHMLHTLTKEGLLEFTRGRKKRSSYRVRVVKGAEDTIENLLSIVDTAEADVAIYTRPQYMEPLPFVQYYNPEAGSMVRNINPEARQYFTTDHCPLVFDVINKHMQVAYRINEDLLSVYQQCQEDPIFTFSNKIDLEPVQLEGLERERDKVLEIAASVDGRRFWEYMFYDSRGRLYSSAVYLTHAGSKLSKSLFLYDKKVALGSEGYFWLFVHAANCWGEDKLSIDGRHDFAEGQWSEWSKWAKDPVNNKGWQEADSPFEFLAAINEINKSHEWAGGPYEFPSSLPVAWDASCSGLQVLSALARDEESGALCNLTDSEVRGDYYKMIADHVWKDCDYTKDDEKVYKKITREMKRHDRKVQVAFRSEDGTKIREALKNQSQYVSENKDALYSSAKVFWGRPEMAKLKRKICKRPCMTYFYSCGERTMAKAMMKDHGSEKEFVGLTFHYCFWLAKKIYAACQDLMNAPTQLMELFVELGLEAYKNGKDFEIDAPLTNFKLIQNYRKDITKKIQVPYKGVLINPRVTVGKAEKIDKSKVMSATSPNVVHMLDSQIVAGIILNAKDKYVVSCIHDSFSTHAGNAGELFHDCREVFIDLFKRDVLTEMLDSLGKSNSIKYGNLDINQLHDNEHNFS